MFAFLSLFAQTDTAVQTSFWIGYIVGQFLGILLLALIVSGLFHLVSLLIKNKRIAFRKVFPCVFVVVLIMGVLGQILRFLR